MKLKSKPFAWILLLSLVFSFTSCKQAASTNLVEAEPVSWEKPRVPDWHKNANIYEVNLRHYSEEGTFAAFQKDLPRLKEMGVDILWFMPIHPISMKNRKATPDLAIEEVTDPALKEKALGSPYAVADYTGVNPDFGTMEDFENLIKAIHDQGMYCIIDWVPNHTGWDNLWIEEHPDWYTKDAEGNITDPINDATGEPWGWTDVADLNYGNEDMRLGMIDAMAFWVEDVGVDGFRVDVAHGVPLDFWQQCTDSLYQIKPLFMLAESAIPDRVNSGAFVMDYGWEMHHLLNEIAKTQGVDAGSAQQLVAGNVVEDAEVAEVEKKTALDIDALLAKNDERYRKGYKMHFTSNHDENAWAGTEFERMGVGHKAFAVLVFTFDGMPLIYTGQEAAMDKQLAFFTKDNIEWGDYPYADFYKTLLELKHRNEALWNGVHGGELVKIPTGKDESVYAFQRDRNGDKVVVIINLSNENQGITLQGDNYVGTYTEVFSGEQVDLEEEASMRLAPWAYRVYSNK
ncbi:MAG TPA: alpha-amylase family glycosyl hydrolase [Saprospiraceae bacterium]|nr:alpha-amylase family glycosyl hydrolase [Saprospiraceae bacterium]